MTVKTSRNSANLLSMPTDLPPAQWTPFKQPVPKPVNSTPRSALASKAPLTRAQKKLARDRQRTATHLARQGIEYQVRPSPLDPK